MRRSAKTGRWVGTLASFLGLAALASAALQEEKAPSVEELVNRLHERSDEHVDQLDLVEWVRRKPNRAFQLAFRLGEELFETEFKTNDGGGANVGAGLRYTRMPRPDLDGPGEWAQHFPPRTTGPNARSCTACHDTPANDGSGGTEDNVHSDPAHTGGYAGMVQRNTPHLFGAGALQGLAEEMTADLQAQRDRALEQAKSENQPVTVSLSTHGVEFGELTARPGDGEDALDLSKVEGVDRDLVIRPFDWKGVTGSLREFMRKALHEELGMQAIELVGEKKDGDFDGVTDELNVGDVTALAVYVAAQPRPTTRREMAALGLHPPISEKDSEYVALGESVFARVGCTSCHVPQLVLADSLFREPSARASHRDARFPAGQDPVELGVDPALPIVFDLVEDLPDNIVLDDEGELVAMLGNFAPASGGGAIVALYGDLKRHDLGPELAEPVDPSGVGTSTYLTENLWGVGSTAPYLHDGRATTLTEAILAHGGEAAPSRDLFVKLPTKDQLALIAFLDDLVLFKLEDVPDGPGGTIVTRPRGP